MIKKPLLRTKTPSARTRSPSQIRIDSWGDVEVADAKGVNKGSASKHKFDGKHKSAIFTIYLYGINKFIIYEI